VHSRTEDKSVNNSVKKFTGCMKLETYGVTSDPMLAFSTVPQPCSEDKAGNLLTDIATSTKSIMTTSSGSMICIEIVSTAGNKP